MSDGLRGRPMSLRQLRLWHWRIAKARRVKARAYDAQADAWESEHGGKHGRCRYARSKARQYNGVADFHIKCVQALNDVVDGTAEQDDAIERAAEKNRAARNHTDGLRGSR